MTDNKNKIDITFKNMIDCHCHAKNSHDGKYPIKKFVAEAEKLGLSYLAITEHYDRDYQFGKLERFCKQLNLQKYKKNFDKAKSATQNIHLAFGVELGYNKLAINEYIEAINKYHFDVIVNSIHTIDGIEAYFGDVFKGKTQEEVYNKYLDLLIESVNAPYHFDIVGHIGYITRYAPYPQKTLNQPQYLQKIDQLLQLIIKKDKTIEINTHMKNGELKFLPEEFILRRYKQLGGENITFSSDAHNPHDICKNYNLVCDVAKEIGFSHFTIFK
ncbi:MAG: histidinol-phosphatase HisJ family protein [Clostridia bacterium]